LGVDIFLSLVDPRRLDETAGAAYRDYSLSNRFEPLIELLRRAQREEPAKVLKSWPEVEQFRYDWAVESWVLESAIDVLSGEEPYTLDGKHDRVEEAAQRRYADDWVRTLAFEAYGLAWGGGVRPEVNMSRALVVYLYEQSELIEDIFTWVVGLQHGANLPAPFDREAQLIREDQVETMRQELLTLTAPEERKLTGRLFDDGAFTLADEFSNLNGVLRAATDNSRLALAYRML